jgi:hypothetical protein
MNHDLIYLIIVLTVVTYLVEYKIYLSTLLNCDHQSMNKSSGRGVNPGLLEVYNWDQIGMVRSKWLLSYLFALRSNFDICRTWPSPLYPNNGP